MKQTYQSQITSKLAVAVPSGPAHNDVMWQQCTCTVSSVYPKCNKYLMQWCILTMSIDELLMDFEKRLEREERDEVWVSLDLPICEAKQLWDCQNPLIMYEDTDFHQHFHFSKENILKIVNFLMKTSSFLAIEACHYPNFSKCVTFSYYTSGFFILHLRAFGYFIGVKIACTFSYYTSGFFILHLRAFGYFIGVKIACAYMTQRRVSLQEVMLIKLPDPTES